ncbi:MAG: uracil-DNA glycosylase [Saprospiraceae bacterium]|nr:uracil-DNA glycosylase [Saprospiraceae bacterium]
MVVKVNIDPTWNEILLKEFEKDYFQRIKLTLSNDKQSGKIIYPPGSLIFNAFNSTPFDKVKVVILGQDPYHNEGEAMGLSFSVPKNLRIPPSLQNIYKELRSDLGLEVPTHGDLSGWASKGVLLLNASLTVLKNSPNSHSKIGWYQFTDAVISKLSDLRSNIVFMLWGNFAKQKSSLIDKSKHLVLESAHPSPLAGGAFFGCKHFSRCNEYLRAQGIEEINWKI